MRRKSVLALAVLVLLVGSASAEEVVHFKSGSTLPIVSHKIEGDMIHVDLGDNAVMAFPLSLVERVVEARGVLFDRSATAKNVMSASPNGAGAVPEQDSLPALQADGTVQDGTDQREYDPAIDVVNGVAVYRPMAGSGNPAKADTAVTGHARVRENRGSPGALNGARQVGTKQVIGAPRGRHGSGPSSAPVITGIEPRSGQLAPVNPPAPPAPPAGGDTQQDGEAGDSSPE